jgi:hypothetical protein
MNYDDWKTADGDDPGRSNGKEQRMLLICKDCHWRISARPIVATAGAVRHSEETGHVISYRGVAQEFSRREA